MIKSARVKNETERLATLRNYGVLDTPAEKDFDDLVALAAHICGAPIALISLVDENRQWFKATFGLVATETSRDVSFCAHAIHQPEVFIVPDATHDERFADNPLVTGDPGIRFYAGSPLVAPDGQALGTLCVIDRQPRQLTAAQAQALSVLSRHVMAQLELRRQSHEMTRANNALLGILEDERLAETALRESEELNRGVLNSMLAHIAVLDRDGKIVAVNDAWRQFACENDGNHPELLARTEVGSNYLEVCRASRGDFSEEAKIAHDGLQAVLRGGKDDFTLEYPCHGRGLKRWFLLSATPLKTKTGGAAVSHLDISERKLAEERIQHLNRVYAVLSDINQTIVREKDSQVMLASACRIAVEKGQFRMAWIGMLEAGTRKVRLTTSAGADAATLKLLSDILGDETRGCSCAFTLRAAQTGEHGVCNDIEHDPQIAHWREAALQRNYRAMASLPLKAGEKVVGTFNLYADELDFFDAEEMRLLDELAADISFALEVHQRENERQKVDEELRWKTALFEALMDSALDGIIVVNNQGKKIFQNQQLNAMWKIPHQIADDPDDAKQVQFIVSRVRNPQQFGEKVAYLYAHPDEISRDEIEMIDGTILDRYSAPVHDKRGKHYGRIWTFRDLTERKQLELQLQQSQKMESVGQLASGVAHDFNNILTVIQGHATLISSVPTFPPQFVESVEQITLAAERAANLTRQLLTFSRKQVTQLRALDLNEITGNLTKMLKRILGEQILLRANYDASLSMVHADPGMMEQVLMNLAVNARDAMPRGGELIISTSDETVDPEYVQLNPQAAPGNYVCLSVADTGCGIPPEILPRIFEPFFTTKEVGKGTGLGLATVYGIVKQHHGWISVYSELGRGTTLRIYLPVMQARAEKEARQLAEREVAGGSETILLVEDEMSVRTLTRNLLERYGYTVIEADSGVSALAVWQKHRDQIKLVLTDMVMPGGLTGIGLMKKLNAEVPALRAVYVSGYSADIVGKDFELREGINFLQKPYPARKLAQTIRRVLDQS